MEVKLAVTVGEGEGRGRSRAGGGLGVRLLMRLIEGEAPCACCHAKVVWGLAFSRPLPC
jgi:hypothetical protein